MKRPAKPPPQHENSFISHATGVVIWAALGLLAVAVIAYAAGRGEFANTVGLVVLYFLIAGVALCLIGHLRKRKGS